MNEEEKNIDDFEGKIGSSKDSGFKIPKGYFDEFQSELELKKNGSSKNEFSVPENYFQESRDRMIGLTKEGSLKKALSKKRNMMLYILSGVAASLLVILAIGQYQEKQCETFACLLEKTEITDEDIQYFEEYEEVDFYIDEEY